ncbi:MAG: hypothetical protein ACRD1N_00860 [Terriglobia bacterium]
MYLRQIVRIGCRCWALLACIVVLLSAGATARAQQTQPFSHIDAAAQSLLNQAIQALGGPAFLGFKTLSTQGRAFSIMDGVTAGFVQYQSAFEFPDKRRLSYGLGKSKSVTLINNGDQGWEVDRYGLIEQPPKEIHAWRLANRYSLENLLRLRVREPGTLIQAGGEDFVNNLPAKIIDIVDSRQVEVKVYLSEETHLPIRITYRLMDPSTHEWDDYADVYASYREAQDVQTAMHLVRYHNGERVAETFRTQARYNQTYASGYFQAGP